MEHTTCVKKIRNKNKQLEAAIRELRKQLQKEEETRKEVET